MSPRTSPRFRADHVGSLLRPPELLAARRDFAASRITAEQLRAVEDTAIAAAVKMQEAVGLQSATDGEFRRASWHMDFIYQLGGISQDVLKRRIEEASRYLPLEQLALSGQCGFSSTVEGNQLTYTSRWPSSTSSSASPTTSGAEHQVC